MRKIVRQRENRNRDKERVRMEQSRSIEMTNRLTRWIVFITTNGEKACVDRQEAGRERE